MSYHTQFGQPIYNHGQKEIWAFWREEHVLLKPQFRFKTVSQLLGLTNLDGSSSITRTPEVIWNGNIWHASGTTLQKDFDEHPSFMMHPAKGPEAALNALDLLLRHKEFCNYFVGETLHSLQMFRRILEEDARNTIPF